MKIYFDESGQSGCVLQKNDLLTFQKQPTFAIGAVVVKDEHDAEKLVTKYTEFLSHFNIEGEIKGSNLLTRARNEELKYVMRNILDRWHFYVILYDKRFYISTLLLLSLLGFEYQHMMPEHFYHQASMLALQEDDFFVAYLKYIQESGVDELSNYLQYLVNYKYTKWEGTENAAATMAKKILSERIVDKCVEDFMTFGWYDNPRITNLINLTALSELIYFIKSQSNTANESIVYVHDHIKEFEDTIFGELKDHGIDMMFADSKQEPLLQIADNVVSIIRHAYDKAMTRFRARAEWEPESEWDMNLLAQSIRKLSSKHISFTVPLGDWSAALCTEIMFNPRYPKKYRNNFHFNYYYCENLRRIAISLSSANRPLEEVIRLLDY